MRDRHRVATPGAPRDVAEFQRAWDGVTPYAIATVVRTVGSTAARPGARAVVTQEGELIGFIGGGCLRRAILNAGAAALAERTPRLIRSAPRDALEAGGVDEAYASGCPSRGEVEVFVEPVLARRPLIVFGDTEIAWRLLDLSDILGLAGVRAAATRAEMEEQNGEIIAVDALGSVPALTDGFIVVATQGAGDKAALHAALASGCPHVLFVASRKKAAHWREALGESGVGEEALSRLIAPAGLAIGAANASEIALAIAAQIVALRRGVPDGGPSA